MSINCQCTYAVVFLIHFVLLSGLLQTVQAKEKTAIQTYEFQCFKVSSGGVRIRLRANGPFGDNGQTVERFADGKSSHLETSVDYEYLGTRKRYQHRTCYNLKSLFTGFSDFNFKVDVMWAHDCRKVNVRDDQILSFYPKAGSWKIRADGWITYCVFLDSIPVVDGEIQF